MHRICEIASDDIKLQVNMMNLRRGILLQLIRVAIWQRDIDEAQIINSLRSNI